ncbi:MAG: hypothetical protein IPO16_14660 [Saprospiraceae bacterium]|nr:hypothetical protein [Saprospiraceae bacterium]
MKDNILEIKRFEREIVDVKSIVKVPIKPYFVDAKSNLKEGYYKSNIFSTTIARIYRPIEKINWSGTDWNVDFILDIYSPEISNINEINNSTPCRRTYLEYYKGNCYYGFRMNGWCAIVFSASNSFSCVRDEYYEFIYFEDKSNTNTLPGISDEEKSEKNQNTVSGISDEEKSEKNQNTVPNISNKEKISVISEMASNALEKRSKNILNKALDKYNNSPKEPKGKDVKPIEIWSNKNEIDNLLSDDLFDVKLEDSINVPKLGTDNSRLDTTPTDQNNCANCIRIAKYRDNEFLKQWDQNYKKYVIKHTINPKAINDLEKLIVELNNDTWYGTSAIGPIAAHIKTICDGVSAILSYIPAGRVVSTASRILNAMEKGEDLKNAIDGEYLDVGIAIVNETGASIVSTPLSQLYDIYKNISVEMQVKEDRKVLMKEVNTQTTAIIEAIRKYQDEITSATAFYDRGNSIKLEMDRFLMLNCKGCKY